MVGSDKKSGRRTATRPGAARALARSVVDEQEQLRPHLRAFVGQRELRDLATPLPDSDTLHLIQALSSG